MSPPEPWPWELDDDIPRTSLAARLWRGMGFALLAGLALGVMGAASAALALLILALLDLLGL